MEENNNNCARYFIISEKDNRCVIEEWFDVNNANTRVMEISAFESKRNQKLISVIYGKPVDLICNESQIKTIITP